MRTLDYNSPIEYPRNVTKDGYTFDERDSNIMPAHNVNITAQWIASMVTIVFDRKTLGDTSALEEVVREIVGTENVIIEFITVEEEEEEVPSSASSSLLTRRARRRLLRLWRASRARRS